MNIRKANQERLHFWSEFAEDAMASFSQHGFTRGEAVQILCAVISGKELVWQAPPGFISSDERTH